MNLYLLVEGKTEKKLYPEWFKHLWPEMNYQEDLDEVKDDDFYVFSSMGIPAIIDDIENAILDIQAHGNIDYFFIIIDAEELSLDERLKEVQDKLEEINLKNIKSIIIVQDKCIETWCLGNSRLCGENSRHSGFQECLNYYNVRELDPELMDRPISQEDFNTSAQYHEYYLKQMFINKSIKYRKGKVDVIGQHTYLDSLISRTELTSHIRSFRHFIDTINTLKSLS